MAGGAPPRAAGRLGSRVPVRGCGYLIQYCQCSAFLHAGRGSVAKDIVLLKAVPASSHAHLVVAGPHAARIVGVGDVIGRGQGPLSGSVHQERDVLDVVILVARYDVEDRPTKLLLDRDHPETQLPDGHDGLFVGIG